MGNLPVSSFLIRVAFEHGFGNQIYLLIHPGISHENVSVSDSYHFYMFSESSDRFSQTFDWYLLLSSGNRH